MKNNLNSLAKEKNIAVLGAGITGLAVVKTLQKRGYPVTLISDTKPDLPLDITYIKDNLPFEAKSLQLLIKSPGIPPKHSILQQAKREGIAIQSEIEWSRRHFSGKVVGITGTDGKSTTTALVQSLFASTYPKTKMGGNIGIPFCQFCEEDLQYAILELSSYQLEDSQQLAMDSTALLNLANDHLERHKTARNYLRAKLKILDSGNDNRPFVTSIHMKDIILQERDLPTHSYYFGETKGCHAQILAKEAKIAGLATNYDTSQFPLLGKHNLENLAAAILLAELNGVKSQHIQEQIAKFNGLAHRFQIVQVKQGVTFINDSKATNLNSLLAGLKGFAKRHRLILILGGEPKQEPLDPLLAELQGRSLLVYLYGQARNTWRTELQKNLGENLIIAEDLQTVMEDVSQKLKKQYYQTVLFSPGCASFDQYKNFVERGESFINFVKKI
ncbi:MAG: UDP-N-acetylmuramoyl-L-alanine--D-glutamate ligase [Spirochaetota bacterium]